MFTNIKYNGMAWTIRSEYLTPIMNEFVKKLDSLTTTSCRHGMTLKGKDVIAGYDVTTPPLPPPSAPPCEGGGGVRILRSTIRRTTLSVPSAGVSDSAPFVNGLSSSGAKEQRVVVKRYHIRRKLKKGIKYLFRRACAKTEWDMMNALLDRGISTCIPLAYGEKRRWGFLLDESLIVREIPDCLTLQAYIKRHYSGTLSKDKILRKRELLRKLANFISHIHEKNIEHRDFHRGNILVTEGDSGEPVFYLIDLHKARVCRRLSLQHRVDNFATILTTRRRRFSKTDCLRLIKHYVEHSNLPTTLKEKKGFKSFASKIFKRVASEQVKRFKKTAKLCLRTGDTFASFIGKDVRIYYRKEYKLANILDLLKRIGRHPENLQNQHIITTTPPSPSTSGIPSPLAKDTSGGQGGDKRGDDVRIIKSNKARTTLSAPFANGQRVIVKRYNIRGWLEKIKYLFIPSRARVEWRMMNALLARGVSAPEPLAYGERRRCGFLLDESLVVKEIPDCISFQDYIKRYCSGTLTKDKVLRKRALLEKLAKFIHYIHENNINHRDSHGDNILVTETDSDEPVFHLIDLHRARVCKKLPLRCRVDNLAKIIDIDTPQRMLSKTDCLRLVRYYNNFHDKKEFKRFASKVLKRARVIRSKRIKSSTRWCLKLSDVFAVYKTKGIRIYYRKEYKLTDILNLLGRIETLRSAQGDMFHNGQCHVLKRSSKSVVFLEEIPFMGVPRKVVIKYNFYRGFFDMLKKTFLGTRSRRAWIAANALIIRGIPTPQPIALIEKKFFGFARDNYLLTEYINGALRVNDYVLKHFNNELNPPEPPLLKGARGIKKKRLFIEELARLFRYFHNTGLYHCDLCGVNILVKEGQEGNWEMFIIDLDSVSLWKRLTLRRRLENFSQISRGLAYITNTDRMRFFKTYFGGLPPKARKYARKITKRIETRRLRKLREHRRKHSHLVHVAQ